MLRLLRFTPPPPSLSSGSSVQAVLTTAYLSSALAPFSSRDAINQWRHQAVWNGNSYSVIAYSNNSAGTPESLYFRARTCHFFGWIISDKIYPYYKIIWIIIQILKYHFALRLLFFGQDNFYFYRFLINIFFSIRLAIIIFMRHLIVIFLWTMCPLFFLLTVLIISV